MTLLCTKIFSLLFFTLKGGLKMDQKHDYLFALDIGTRSVIGVIFEKKGKEYSVLDIVMKEHHERSMLDGQIHDTILVSEVITAIKKELEQKYGPLTSVYVAAAGRALKTARGKSEKNITIAPLTTREEIAHLELSAVQQALHTLAEEKNEQTYDYYCVGYSVVHYELDQQKIGNLMDQRGDIAKAEVIATFLPRIVVESLLAALKRAGLEMAALTLEPIAAINVLVPSSMRRLNIALVDIGAGTSDIAITKEQTIIAYGMVPVAGDEITEAICDACLLDFNQAEEVKRSLTKQASITYNDILGFEQEKSTDELIQEMDPAIELLAEKISNEILSLNKTPPQAVMLIGGGSLTPGLSKRLAKKLTLPENRVAIRGSEAIKTVKQTNSSMQGPLFITPIGIGVSALEHPITYMTVHVNEQEIRLFDFNHLTIGDALIARGIDIQKLYGKPGMGITFEWNNTIKTIPGRLGGMPKILKNKKEASLLDPIKHHDVIVVSGGKDGQDASITVADLKKQVGKKSVTVNNHTYTFYPNIFVNQKRVDDETVITSKDNLQINIPTTIHDVLEEGKIKPIQSSFSLSINGQPFSFTPSEKEQQLFRNGVPCSQDEIIYDGDSIDWVTQGFITTKELKYALRQSTMNPMTIQVSFNNQSLLLGKNDISLKRNDQLLQDGEFIENHDVIFVSSLEEQTFIFQDIFRYIDLDLTNTSGKRFVLLVNGEEANFYTPIQHGDQLELKWI